MSRFSGGYPAAPWAFATPESFYDCGSKFVCNSTCCTVRPTAPAHGIGVYAPTPYGFGASPACSGVAYGGSCAPCDGYTASNRGPAGWAEVGWLESVNVPRPARRGSRRQRHRRRQVAEPVGPNGRGGGRGRQGRRSSIGSTRRQRDWTPRAQYRQRDDLFADKFDDDYDNDDFYYDDHDDALLSVGCRVRRYRLYARPAYGWCGSFDVHQFQYAVTDETVPRCDAIFIVLRDDPRADAKRYGVPYQPLQTGELVVVPGEPTLFRVRLYADDRVY